MNTAEVGWAGVLEGAPALFVPRVFSGIFLPAWAHTTGEARSALSMEEICWQSPGSEEEE
jgi:hypothetical protein